MSWASLAPSGKRSVVPWPARGVRPLLLRQRAGRPQLTRDPLGGTSIEPEGGGNHGGRETCCSIPISAGRQELRPSLHEGSSADGHSANFQGHQEICRIQSRRTG